MPKSNGRPMTWDRHNKELGGRLQEIVNAISKLPGVHARNQARIEALAKKRRAAMEALTATEETKKPKTADAIVLFRA